MPTRKQIAIAVRLLAIACLAFPVFFLLFASYTTFHSVRTFYLYGTEQAAVSPHGHGSHDVLLVSALFPLAKSKHSMDDYRSWMARFLGTVKTDIYFFTPPEMEPLIAELRGDLPITINTTFSSPYDIPPLSGLKDYYEEMHKIDRENSYHSPELYAVWNGKAYYLEEGMKNSKKTYKYVFWTDAGGFRGDHVYEWWPDYQRLEELWNEGSKTTNVQKHDLFFIPTTQAPGSGKKHWTEDKGPVDIDFSEGSFFGGQPEAVRWWRRTFYAYHDYYRSMNMFVGKDQTVFNAIILLYSHRMITVWLDDPQAPARKGLVRGVDGSTLGRCGSEWYYYEFFLADAFTRQQMREIWNAEAKSTSEWWKNRQTCRLTRLLAMKELLSRQFGPKWIPPDATVLNSLGDGPLIRSS
ncbi:hypothetical protein K435DRAFT_816021 [Dendrothele bispora CBS 962.96]|uniref:Uncharacterized protein n=1 Tax=Dendrothele bispora (strain CBS 962.96) TaxID=1314807 RepID=A0A4S8MSY1_DENBC|nr:hypothetical protein K435DRAFT_816021 [Dendrothele bispora CBS 962.96]